MEKRRRARINNCLLQLKSLVLQAMKKDVSIQLYIKHSKIEIQERKNTTQAQHQHNLHITTCMSN
jgi:hypothetical protein